MSTFSVDELASILASHWAKPATRVGAWGVEQVAEDALTSSSPNFDQARSGEHFSLNVDMGVLFAGAQVVLMVGDIILREIRLAKERRKDNLLIISQVREQAFGGTPRIEDKELIDLIDDIDRRIRARE